MYKEYQFMLLGHDNPLGRYPAPVVPIGLLYGKLVAVYASAAGPVVVNVSEESVYIAHEHALAERLSFFDYNKHRLFAFNEQHVDYYPIARETDYFLMLLADPNFSPDNPFLKLSLAKSTRMVGPIRKELAYCTRKLWHSMPEDFVESWYERERENILSVIDAEHHSNIPQTWKVLILIHESDTPSIISVRPPSGHFRPFTSGSAYWGAASAGAAAGAALMVIAVFSDRVYAEAAYQALLKRNYAKNDINILMTEETQGKFFPELKNIDNQDPGASSDGDSIVTLLTDSTHIDISSYKIVCAGPYATRLAGINDNHLTGDLVAGLISLGLTEEQAQFYDYGVRAGGIMMGVTSVPDTEIDILINELRPV